MAIEYKAPQDTVLDLPQERITGDILRGHGPRRGNLEDLLRYWRPIMRKPGGFRRCLVILADHPELYPLPNMCAWLHHETTGKWPNEGNHHGTRGAGRAVRRVVGSAVRHAKTGEALGEVDIEVTARRVERRIARATKSVIVQPIAGRQNVVNYKASRAARALVSLVLPGERGITKRPGRRVLYHALTPGGAGRAIPSVGTSIRGGVRAARPKRRCPAGYEHGGRFADAAGVGCGRRVVAGKSEAADIEKKVGAPASA